MASIRLNLGSGQAPKAGFVNVDNIRFPGTSLVADLDKPLPFKAGTADYIYLSHVLEHLRDRMVFLAEANRVLKAGGIIELVVPHKSSGLAHHLDHLTYFAWATFSQAVFDEGFVRQTIGKFKVQRLRLRLLGGRDTPFDFFINRFPRHYEWFFPCSEVLVKLQKLG